MDTYELNGSKYNVIGNAFPEEGAAPVPIIDMDLMSDELWLLTGLESRIKNPHLYAEVEGAEEAAKILIRMLQDFPRHTPETLKEIDAYNRVCELLVAPSKAL